MRSEDQRLSKRLPTFNNLLLINERIRVFQKFSHAVRAAKEHALYYCLVDAIKNSRVLYYT